MKKLALSVGLILAFQVAFARNLPKECIDELLDIPKTDENFALQEFLKELPTTVIKIKAQAKLGETPVIGFFFGPGPDNKVTDIGITVGCAKAFPESPGEILAVLKDVSLEMARIASMPRTGAIALSGTSGSKPLTEIQGKTALEVADCNISSSESSIYNMTDNRDGKKYKTVKIGSQTWMAENLNYDADDSKCYDNDSGNCAKYGRLYNWSTALRACPSGWHLPEGKEWDALTIFIDGGNSGGTKLKAKSCWNNNGNGMDEFGFSALPGGYGSSNDDFLHIGSGGLWWGASEFNSYSAYYRFMPYNYDYVYWSYFNKSFLFSVRCVQD